jgi:hypothetical protein
MSFKYQSVIGQTDSEIEKNKKDKKTSKYQSVIDQIDSEMEKNKKDKKTSKYQSVIDQIDSEMAGGNTSSGASAPEDRLQSLFDQSNGKDDEAPKKTSKYQDTIDQINAQIEAQKEGRELHTVPPAGALENYFDTTMDFLKYGPQSNSTAKGFKQWTEENKGEFIFDRGDVESGVISAAGKKETLSPVHMKAESKTPSATIQAVSDVGVSTKPNSLEDVLARVTILQSEASELDKQKNAAVKVQNNIINDLQREKDLLMQQGSDVDYRRIDDIDRKISEAQNDPRITEIDSKIAEVEEGIYSLYTMITKMSDFNTNSGYVPSVRKDENGQYVNTEPGSIMFPSKKYDESAFGDVKYDAINKNKDAQTIYNNNRFQDDKLGVSGGASYSDMSRDEIGVYNYLYSQVSPEEANRFLDAIEGSLNARKRYRYTKEVERFAEKHPWISSAAVLATTPLQSVSAIGQIADYVDDGKVDQNAPYNLFSQLPNAAKAEVRQLVEDEWGPVGSSAYNIGMGLGEIIVTRGFTLNNRPLGLAVMTSRVGADTVIDAKDRGLSDDQAVALGVVAAAAEALTENISWKALESFVDRAGKSELVKYLAKNMITEAGEESISGLSNFLADAVISRDKSELRTSIAHYMSEDGGNLSESQAIKKTFGDMVKSLETDALYGAISGGILAGGYAGVQGIVNRVGSDPFEKQVNKAIKRKNVQLSALDALIAADDAKKINAAAKFINTVSKYSDESVNSVNAALELMRKQGLEIYEEIKAIDNAGVLPNQSEQEAVQKTRAELQSRYDALVATDEMIRSHLKEIEAARKRNENVEFTDPGAFSAEEITEENVSDIPVSDTKAETSQGDDTANENEDEKRYKRYAQSAVQEALNTAEALDSDVAAEQLKRAFGGDLRAAVDALRLSEREIRSGNSRLTTNDISSLRTIDETLRRNNAKYIERAANNLRRSLAKYGVKNVVVGGDDFSGYNNVRNKANYNRSTGVLTVSPYLDTDAVIAASVVHEFTHHGVTHDLALVNDAVSLIDGARSAGVILDNELVYSNYEAAYRDEALNYVRTENGQSAVKKYTNAGMSATEAQARVIKDYINEELASDFLGILLTKDTNSREFKMFAGQNRNVIQRILDAITSFIRRIKGENANADVKQYERAVELLRGALNNHTTNQAKMNSGNPVSTATEAVAKAEDAEVRAEPYTEPEVVDSVVSDTNDSVVDVAEEEVAEAEAAEEEGVRDTVNEEFESLFDSPGEYYEDTYKETENVEGTTEENLAESDSTSEEKYDITEEDYETLDYILGLDSEGETEKYDITEEDYETLDYILRTSDGEAVAYDAGDGSVRWSVDTYRKNGRDTLMRYIQSRVDSGSLSKADGDDIVKTMDRICEICETMTGEYAPFGEWSYASVEVDKNGNPVFSVIKPNGEYIMNLDFSLVCKKRRALDAVFNEMIRRGVISKFDIGQDKIVKINDIIRKKGLEVACSACFVDAKRFRQSKVADDFVKMYNSLVRSMAKNVDAAYFNFGGDSSLPDVQNGIDTLSDSDLDMTTINKVLAAGGKSVRYKIAKHLAENPSDRKLLSRGDFMSTRGFNLVKKVNPDVLSLYNSKKGSGGPKASFGDVQYLSDIIRSGKFKADKAYSVGGVRVQSFSDYVARLVFDYVQMIGDLAAKELPAHAYTKEVLFVKQFGLTGMKINMSLMPAVGDGKYAGLNADGSYAWANESFDYDAAMEIQSDPEYAKNCGTIAVGISDQHIWKLLSDPNIRMVIPYHKSGINPVVAEMNKINRFTNYTNDQNTRYKDGKKLSAEDAKGVPNFNELMHNGMNAIEASRAYVEWCESKGYKPKFDRFVYNADGTFNENYYKLLEDFTTMVDGVYHPQGAVKAVFPTEGSAFGSMEQLIREGLEQDAVDQFARDEKVGGIVDEVVSMLEEDSASVRKSKDVVDSRYDYSKSFSEQIDDYIDGKFPLYDTLVIGGTPLVFREIGLKALPMTYGTRHLKDVIVGTKADHDFGVDNLKLLPKALENPIAIFTSKTHPETSVVSIVDLSYNEKPLFVAAKVDGTGQINGVEIDSNAVTTAHTRNNASKLLRDAIDNYFHGEVSLFYVNKKEAIKLLDTSRVQFPGVTDLPDGFVNSIHDNGSPVKGRFEDVTQSKQFKHWFGDWENRSKNASKVVNKNGTPKVMYHYTNSYFTVFDPSKSGSNQGKSHGDGIYMSSDPNEFAYAGSNKMELYANIRNPFEMQLTSAQADYVLNKYASTKHDLDAYDGVYRNHARQKLLSPSRVFDYLSEYAADNNVKTSDILKDLGFDGVHDGSEWVAFEATQIKSATNNIGTFDVDNPDIRYAKDVADVRSTEEKLRAENEYLKRQFMSRNGDEWAKAVSPEDVRRVSREIAKDLPGVAAGAVEAEFAEVVKVLQRKLTKDYSADARYRDAMEAAKAAAAKLIMQTDKVTVNNEWLDIRDLKKKLRDTKVYVSENVASEFPDWQSVRKEISGALSVVTTDRSALPLDSFYSELAEEYPEYFPAEIKIPQQQMERVIKVAKELKEIRQYNHETLWVDAEDTGDTISAEMANSDLVQSFANVILAKYNESAMETLAAQLRREKDSQRWDSNSTRNMLAELQREIPLAQENAKQTIERHMRATRQKVSQFMALYNEQMDALKAEVEQANADAEWLSNRLAHHDERNKITTQRKRYSRNLKTLYNLLTKPTDKRHIPEGLQRAVVDLLSNFSGVNLDNGQTIDPEVLRNLKARFSMDNGGDAVGALERLVNVVRLNKTSADFSVSDGFIDDLQRTVDLAKEILNEPKTLSKGELQDQIDYYAAYGQNYFAQREFEYLSQVNRVLSMVQKYINDSNKVFLGGKREYASDMADQVAYEMRNRSKRSNVPDNALLGADNRPTEFAYDQMQADTFWHMFGDFGDMIMKSYRKAQNYQMEHEAEYADWVKKNIFDVFKNGKGKRYNTHDLGWGGSLVTVSVNGKKFEITKAQLMSCYVTWNQPEGKTHMTNGGVFFKSQKGEEVESRHVVFTDESFAKLMENLSEQDKTVCDKIVKFLSKRGAAWGNEASMYLYGYKKFMKDYYFPIMAAKSALPVNWDQMTEFSKLESKGMTKARKGDAKNAILIDDFFDVADNHVRNMAAYSAFAPLNNDVRRIFDMGKAQSAVKSVLGDKTTGGKNKKMGGWGYLVDFLQNVDQNKVMATEQLSSSKALRILSSMYKRQAVSASLSTALKQPTSYVRAWNVLDGKYLTMAFADKSFVPGSSEYKRIMKDMAEHSGVAKMKLLGYSDTGSAKSLRAIYDSNYSMLGDEFTNAFARNAVKGYEKTSDLFMIAAETMDKWTWIRLWKACELEVDAKNKGLSRHERTEAVSELFNQVIGETQVVDTVLDSTPALRNSDGLTQQMYAFMKEPIKTVNTVFRAWDDVKTGKKGAKKAMTKALVTFAVSNMILEPLISALFGMLRDEEDEEGIFLQKLGNSMFGIPMKGERFNLLDVLTSESVSSIYNTIPIVEEFADVLFSRLQGYDIERMDVTGLTKAIDAVVALCEYDSKKTKTLGNTVSDVVTSFAGLFGIPAYTLKRDVSAAFRLWYQWTDNYEAQWDLNKLFYNLNNGSARSQKNFYDIIGHVIREADEDAYQYIREDLSNVFTSDRKGLSANDMLKYMKDRKVEFDYTSRLWNIELQANFDLPQFVSNMKVEPLITDVYRKTGDSSVLPIPPSDNFKVKADAKFSDKLVWNSENDEGEDSRTVTFKNQADLAEYTEKVGDYAYKTLLCFVDNSLYKRLNDEQKAYAVKQVYKFAQAKFKTELYTDYDPNNKDFAWHIKRGSSPDLVARDILNAAWNYES